jgi:hypothetical protein
VIIIKSAATSSLRFEIAVLPYNNHKFLSAKSIKSGESVVQTIFSLHLLFQTLEHEKAPPCLVCGRYVLRPAGRFLQKERGYRAF